MVRQQQLPRGTSTTHSEINYFFSQEPRPSGRTRGGAGRDEQHYDEGRKEKKTSFAGAVARGGARRVAVGGPQLVISKQYFAAAGPTQPVCVGLLSESVGERSSE